jgi:hypothetical protein
MLSHRNRLIYHASLKLVRQARVLYKGLLEIESVPNDNAKPSVRVGRKAAGLKDEDGRAAEGNRPLVYLAFLFLAAVGKGPAAATKQHENSHSGTTFMC